MVDPITVLGTGLAALGSKDIVNKILGPTAEYLGAKTAGLVEKCDLNLDKIFVSAYRKLGARAERPGGVSPRVLRHVVEDGKFVEDELVAEYYGGMLAGSKTASGADDRGIPHLSRVKAMSVFQIRLHFLIYISVLRIFRGGAINVGDQQDRRKLKIYVPYESATIALQPEPLAVFHSVFSHAINGLYSLGLIGEFSYGSVEHLKKSFPGVSNPGFIVEPNFIGAELFLWAIGIEDPNAHQFLFADPTTIATPIKVEQTALPLSPPEG